MLKNKIIIVILILLQSCCNTDSYKELNKSNSRNVEYICLSWYNNISHENNIRYFYNPDSINYVLSLFKEGKVERLNRKNTIQDIAVNIVTKNSESKIIVIDITITENNEVYYTADWSYNPGYRNDSILFFLKEIGYK